jgi:hypothetical protein
MDSVDWDAVERSLESSPEMFRLWVTKHMSHFCGALGHEAHESVLRCWKNAVYMWILGPQLMSLVSGREQDHG